MPKGKSRDEATLNSEKIKPITLAVIELCFSKGISQLVIQPVANKILKQLFGGVSGHTKGTFWLGYT